MEKITILDCPVWYDKTNIINKRHIITFVPYKYE